MLYSLLVVRWWKKIDLPSDYWMSSPFLISCLFVFGKLGELVSFELGQLELSSALPGCNGAGRHEAKLWLDHTIAT